MLGWVWDTWIARWHDSQKVDILRIFFLGIFLFISLSLAKSLHFKVCLRSMRLSFTFVTSTVVKASFWRVFFEEREENTLYSISFICKCINRLSKVRNRIPSLGYFITVFYNVRRVLSFERLPIYLFVLTSWEFVVSPLSLALSLLLWKLVKALTKPCWPCCFIFLLRTRCAPSLNNTN